MNDSPTILDKFRTLPRAIQWAVLGGVGLLLFLFTNDYVWAAAGKWSAQADVIEQNARKVYDDKPRLAKINKVKKIILAHGALELPGSEAKARDALTAAVTDVMKANAFNADRYQISPGGNIKTKTRDSGSKKISTVVAQLDFVAKPSEALKIIAELEADPRIEVITELSIRKETGRRGVKNVSVHLSLEAWVSRK